LRKFFLLLATFFFAIILLFSTAPVKADGPYVGSKNSNVYHYPSCSEVAKIKPENRIYFTDAQDAVNQGYHPCSVCKPPLPVSTTSPSLTATATPTAKPTITASPTTSPTEKLIATPTPTATPINPTYSPVPTATANPTTTLPTPASPTRTPTITSTPSPTDSTYTSPNTYSLPTITPTANPPDTPTTPEFPTWTIIAIFTLTIGVLIVSREHYSHKVKLKIN
jgi:hypothetical protein